MANHLGRHGGALTVLLAAACAASCGDTGSDLFGQAEPVAEPDGSAGDAAGPDAKGDAPADAKTDKPSASDSGTDSVPPEAAADAHPEPQPDAGPEPSPEAGPDASPDVAVDVKPDVTPDAKPDVTPDAKPDVTADAPVDAKPDTAPNPGETCSNPIPVTASPAQLTSSTAGLQDNYSDLCGNLGGSAPDVVFTFNHGAGDVLASTFGPTTTWDTVISLRSGCGTGSGTELACSDDTRGMAAPSRFFYHGLPAGTYQLIVDSASPNVSGPFDLQIAQPQGPAQFQCASQLVSISDANGAPIGLDIYDYVPTGYGTDHRNVRNGQSCAATNGVAMHGYGGEQVYDLNLSAQRTLNITMDFVQATYAGVLYIRKDGGFGAGCTSDWAQPNDTCVPYGNDFQLAAGHYWLIVDVPSNGDGTPAQGARYHVHVDVR